MSMLTRHRLFLRCVSLFTAITFLPTSVQAWHFIPAPAAIAGKEVLDLDTLLDREASLRAPLTESGTPTGSPFVLAQALAAPAAPSTPPTDVESALAAVLPTTPQTTTPQAPEIPQLAQTEGVAGNLGLAATPSPAPGLRALSREALEGATGGPRVTGHNPYDAGLPDADSILAHLREARGNARPAGPRCAGRGQPARPLHRGG